MFEELEYFVTVNVIEFLQMNDCVVVCLVVELQYIAVDWFCIGGMASNLGYCL